MSIVIVCVFHITFDFFLTSINGVKEVMLFELEGKRWFEMTWIIFG